MANTGRVRCTANLDGTQRQPPTALGKSVSAHDRLRLYSRMVQHRRASQRDDGQKECSPRLHRVMTFVERKALEDHSQFALFPRLFLRSPLASGNILVLAGSASRRKRTDRVSHHRLRYLNYSALFRGVSLRTLSISSILRLLLRRAVCSVSLRFSASLHASYRFVLLPLTVPASVLQRDAGRQTESSTPTL